HHLIDRTGLRRLHAIAYTGARGQRNGGRLHPGLAQFLGGSPAIFFRKHDIDNEKIKLARVRGRRPRLAVRGNIDNETGFTKTFCQKSRRLLFVFDHQNSHKADNPFLPHSPARASRQSLKSMSESKRMGKTREWTTYEIDLSRPAGRAITSPASRNVVAAENRQKRQYACSRKA